MTAFSWKSPWLRRVAFVLGNLGVVAIAIFVVVMPVLGFFQDRDKEIATKRAMLARLVAIAAQESSIQKRANQSDAEVDRGEFLVGSTGVATADLQTKLKSIAGAAGAQARSVQGLPSKTEGQLRYIGARIELQGPIQSIHRAIHAIESGKPFLFITEAAIKPAVPVGIVNPSQEPVIQAQLDVFGAGWIEGRDQ